MSNVEDKCHVCGNCWWQGCENPADTSVDVELRSKGQIVYDGIVDLCMGHWVFVNQRGGRMNLSWEAINQAKEMMAAKGPRKLKAAR